MTRAVCFSCGEMKFGAFTPCRRCKAIPLNGEDLTLSLALTDHYFRHRDLQTLSRELRSIGDVQPGDPQVRAHLEAAVVQLHSGRAPVEGPRRHPWWPFK